METTGDQKAVRSQSQELSSQIGRRQQSSFAADDTSTSTGSELMDDAVQSGLQEPSAEEKNNKRLPATKDGMETLLSGSTDSPDCQHKVSACDKEHNSPRTSQHSGNGDSILHDIETNFPRRVPCVEDDVIRGASTTKPPAGFEIEVIRDASTTKRPAEFGIAKFLRTPRNELSQQPASNIVGTHNSGDEEVIPESHSTAGHEPTWTDCATQTAIGPTTFKAGSARPISVPNFKSQSGSRGRREGPAYPNYPDQSFAALQSQYHPPPYQPHPLRTRSSQSSHNASYSSDSSAKVRDFSTMQSGARTVGNTPAQSPGLFAPSVSRNRPAAQDSEDFAARTPNLHPAQNLHLQAPIE